MPAPQSVQLKSGQLLIDRSFSVAVTGFRDPMLERGVQRFVGELSRETGIPFFPKSAPGPRATLAVHAESGIGKVQKLSDDESYELIIDGSGATLNAPTTLGILHGLQAFYNWCSQIPPDSACRSGPSKTSRASSGAD